MTAKSSSLAGPAAAATVILFGAISRAADSLPEVAFRDEPGKVQILVGGRTAATYVFDDREILRP